MYSDLELREIARAAKMLAAAAAALKVAEEPTDVRRSANRVALLVRRLALRFNPAGRYGTQNVDTWRRGTENILSALPALHRPDGAQLGPLLTTVLLSLKSIARCVGLPPEADWGKPAKIQQCRDENLLGFVSDIRGSAALAVDEMGKAAVKLEAALDKRPESSATGAAISQEVLAPPRNSGTPAGRKRPKDSNLAKPTPGELIEAIVGSVEVLAPEAVVVDEQIAKFAHMVGKPVAIVNGQPVHGRPLSPEEAQKVAAAIAANSEQKGAESPASPTETAAPKSAAGDQANGAASAEVARELVNHPLGDKGQSGSEKPDQKPDPKKNTFPPSGNVNDFITELTRRLPNGDTLTDVARDFADKRGLEVDSLLRQARCYSHLYDHLRERYGRHKTG